MIERKDTTRTRKARAALSFGDCLYAVTMFFGSSSSKCSSGSLEDVFLSGSSLGLVRT